MSVAEAARRSPPRAVEQSLCGWGRTAHSRSKVVRAGGVEDVLAVVSSQTGSGSGVIARGAGRSYGDAAQNEGGQVLDMSTLRRIISIDAERRLITAQAGATIGQMLRALAAQGLSLPVVPGTRHVTLAGAIASDIHGKNHHRDGGLARHVLAVTLCTPADGLLELSAESDPDLFYATLGGMGLTGVIVQGTLRAEVLASPWLTADIERTEGLEQTLELMSADERHRYSVAWLDLLAGGTKMGRAVLSRADPLSAEDVPARPSGRRPLTGAYPHSLARGATVEVPRGLPWSMLRPGAVRAFNAVRWRATPSRQRARTVALVPYFFPLDGLGAWNRLYGPAGLVQYQFVIPAGQEGALRRCFELMRARRLPVYLAVFKRFGAAFGGPLSFPLEGWTLAVDLPAAAPGLGPALEELDEHVAGCGGRVYLTKDVRLRREMLAAMYPELPRFQQLRARVDPEGVLRSDLGRRLGLCGAAG
jgi:decaprenylphospho-beta-D-ribofuranose 2-oxidase